MPKVPSIVSLQLLILSLISRHTGEDGKNPWFKNEDDKAGAFDLRRDPL